MPKFWERDDPDQTLEKIAMEATMRGERERVGGAIARLRHLRAAGGCVPNSEELITQQDIKDFRTVVDAGRRWRILPGPERE